jgi:hypothetical protein
MTVNQLEVVQSQSKSNLKSMMINSVAMAHKTELSC